MNIPEFPTASKLSNFSLNEAALLNAVRGGGLLSIVNSVISPGYGIYHADGDKTGSKALSPTSFVVVETSADASIATAPVEKGGYSSFNKVRRPSELHVTFAIEGWTGFSGKVPNLTNFSTTSRSDTLAQLEKMRISADLYDIETPDKVFSHYDLTKYDWRVRSDSGVTLLVVTATFQEVLNVGEVTIGQEEKNKTSAQNTSSKAPSVKTENVTGATTKAPDNAAEAAKEVT